MIKHPILKILESVAEYIAYYFRSEGSGLDNSDRIGYDSSYWVRVPIWGGISPLSLHLIDADEPGFENLHKPLPALGRTV